MIEELLHILSLNTAATSGSYFVVTVLYKFGPAPPPKQRLHSLARQCQTIVHFMAKKLIWSRTSLSLVPPGYSRLTYSKQFVFKPLNMGPLSQLASYEIQLYRATVN